MIGQTRTDAPKALEEELAELRALAYAQSPDAARLTSLLRERIERFAARVDVVTAIATGSGGDARAKRSFVRRANDLKRELVETEALIDLAAALWASGRETDAIDTVQGALAATTGIDPNLFLPVMEMLFRTDRAAEANALARAFLGELSLGLGDDRASYHLQNISRDATMRVRLLEQLLALVRGLKLGGDTKRVARRLEAAALCELGRPADGLDAVHRILRRGPDPTARWVAAVASARMKRFEAALGEVGHLGSVDASRPEVVAFRIRALVFLGRADDGVRLGTEALSRNPDDIGITVETIRARAESGDAKAALHELDHLIEQHPERGELWRAKGRLLRRKDRLPAAVRALEQAIARDPTDARSLSLLGQTLAQMGKVDQSLSMLDRALAVSHDPGEVLFERGRILHEQQRDVEALDVVRESLDRGRQGHDILGLYGDILRALDRDDEAAIWYRKALKEVQRVDDEEAHRYESALDEMVEEQRAQAYRLADEKSYTQALEILTRLQRDHRLDAGGMGTRAEILRITGQRKEAIAQADEALDTGADPTFVRGTKGMALVELSRSAEGVKVLEPALESSPDYLFGRYAQVLALNELGRVGEGLAILDAHFPEGKTDETWASAGVWARAAFMVDLGRYTQAAAYLEAALEHGADADWLGALGWTYGRLGRFDEAAGLIRRAIDMPGVDPTSGALNELADALRAGSETDPTEAAAVYARVLDSQPLEPTPKDVVQVAWALLRTGQLDAAIKAYRSALTEADDPLLSERVRLVLALEIAGQSAEADVELDRARTGLDAMIDRERAAAILTEARFVAAMLERDHPNAIRPRTIERLA